MSLPFSLDFLPPADSSWGPQKSPMSLDLSGIPYAVFSKSDKLGKAADWYSAEQQNNMLSNKNQKGSRDPFHAFGSANASKLAAEEVTEDSNSFEVVDTKTNAQQSQSQNQQHQKTILRGRGGGKRGGGQLGAGQRNPNYQRSGPASKPGPQTPQQQRSNHWNIQNQNQIDDNIKRKKYSIDIEPNFTKLTDFDFSKLTKLILDLGANSKGDTLSIKANPALVKMYNKSFDKLSSSSNLNKKKVPLRVFEKEAPATYIDTREDEILMNYAKDNTADVLITSEILTRIMGSTKSHFPWSVRITKDIETGKLYFSNTDVETFQIVDENDSDLFSSSFRVDENNVNSFVKLSKEFLAVNYNLRRFASSSTSVGNSIKIEGSKALEPESSYKSGTIYKYKLFKIPENTNNEDTRRRGKKMSLAKPKDGEEESISYINVVVRTEADLLMKAGSGDSFETVAVHALNQYKPTQLDWKTKLNSSRGAIMSTELRKNNNLFSRWITSSLLADVENIKLAFIGRDSYASADAHSILGMFNYKPQDLARQSNLQVNNGWAIFKSVIDIVNHASEEVKEKDVIEFVLARDPVNAKLAIYRID